MSKFSKTTAVVEVTGILMFAGVATWAGNGTFRPVTNGWTEDITAGGFPAAVAPGILAYEGFTTITGRGSQLVDPERDAGRSSLHGRRAAAPAGRPGRSAHDAGSATS